MTQVTIAVPTHETLSEEYEVDVEATWPDGSPITGDITAIVTGQVGDPNCEISSIVVDAGGSEAISVDELPDLRSRIVGAMARDSPKPLYK